MGSRRVRRAFRWQRAGRRRLNGARYLLASKQLMFFFAFLAAFFCVLRGYRLSAERRGKLLTAKDAKNGREGREEVLFLAYDKH